MLLRGERTLLDKSVRANESITSYKKINNKHTRNYIMDFLVKQFLNTMTLSDFKTSLNDFKLSLRESHHLTLLAPISQNGHSQTIRRQIDDELFDCVWPFCGIRAWRINEHIGYMPRCLFDLLFIILVLFLLSLLYCQCY